MQHHPPWYRPRRQGPTKLTTPIDPKSAPTIRTRPAGSLEYQLEVQIPGSPLELWSQRPQSDGGEKKVQLNVGEEEIETRQPGRLKDLGRPTLEDVEPHNLALLPAGVGALHV